MNQINAYLKTHIKSSIFKNIFLSIKKIKNTFSIYKKKNVFKNN